MARARTWLILLVLGGLAAYAGLAVQVFRAATWPESFAGRGGIDSWRIGPSARRLHEAAEGHVDRGLVLLQDRSLPSADRVRAYREELVAAEALLVCSLRAQANQPRALAQLAAVRWELAPPRTEVALARTIDTIALASSMAPTSPRVQRQLGELLLRMGRLEEAVPYLQRAIRLAESTSDEVVNLLHANLLDAGEILRLLPDRPEVLTALRPLFVQERREPEFLDAVEARLAGNGPATRPLLAAYGGVALDSGHAARLRDRLDSLGPYSDPELEAERLRQRSRAHLALQDSRTALQDARRTLALAPTPPYVEHLGDVLMVTGATEEAIAAFRRALGLVARGGGHSGTRVRLYYKIGQAEEQRGGMAQAYDAYKLALKLDPDDPLSRGRIEQMERAAGVKR